MSRRRRPSHTEPIRCACRPGKFAHPQHGKPRNQVGAHHEPGCPHSQLAVTTAPVSRRRKPRNLRLDLQARDAARSTDG